MAKTYAVLYGIGDGNSQFSGILLPKIWIFIEGVGEEIKSRQAFKRDRTLKKQQCTTKQQLTFVTIMCNNNELNWRMSQFGCLLADKVPKP